MERLTAKHFKKGDGYYLRCSELCQASCCEGCDIDGQDVDRLGEIEDILGDDYDLDRLRELVEADKDGRCIVLPCKTVFVPTWDSGPGCDGNCPKGFYGEEPCNKCSRGKMFVYERPCRQEHISLLGKTVFATREAAEASLGRMIDNDKR